MEAHDCADTQLYPDALRLLFLSEFAAQKSEHPVRECASALRALLGGMRGHLQWQPEHQPCGEAQPLVRFKSRILPTNVAPLRHSGTAAAEPGRSLISYLLQQ